jgi:hypothetical protein
MKVYRLDEAAVRALLRRRFIWFGAILLVVVAIMAPVVPLLQGEDPRSSADVIVPTFGLIAIVVVLSLWRSSSRQRKWVMTYALKITESEVSREQEHVAPVRIARDDITKIVEGDGGLAVMTASPERCISVPRTLEEYTHARDALAVWRAIEPAEKPRWMPTIVATVAILIAAGTSARAPWPWAVIASIALWAILAYLVWVVRRSPEVPRNQKNVATVLFVWLAFTPIGRIVLSMLNDMTRKLAGH